MGRNRTGVTTSESLRIEMSYLLKKGFFSKGKIILGEFSWTNGSKIGIETQYTENIQYIRLNYVHTNWQGEKTEHDYKIQVSLVPSNLGKGNVPYFICPVTGGRCRILYKAYGSSIWKSRRAYKYTIFYPSQISSKLSIMNDEYWRLEKLIKKLEEQSRNQTHYKGKPTRRYKRLQLLRTKQRKADYLRFSPVYMPKSLKDFIF
jgi:hypothetical protein